MNLTLLNLNISLVLLFVLNNYYVFFCVTCSLQSHSPSSALYRNSIDVIITHNTHYERKEKLGKKIDEHLIFFYVNHLGECDSYCTKMKKKEIKYKIQ